MTSSSSSAPSPRSSPRRSAWSRTTSSGSSPIRPARSSATCSSPLGVGAYGVGMFHLFTHAFFKALLFLGAGSVIHAMHHEQDMRNMGGLRRKIPITYCDDGDRHAGADRRRHPGHSIGFAGFYSKDAIIEAAYAARRPARGTSPSGRWSSRRCLTTLLFLAPDLHDLPRQPRGRAHGRDARRPRDAEPTRRP